MAVVSFTSPIVAFLVMQIGVLVSARSRTRVAAFLPMVVFGMAFSILNHLAVFYPQLKIDTYSSLLGILTAVIVWCFGIVSDRGSSNASSCVVPIAIGLLYVAAQAEQIIEFAHDSGSRERGYVIAVGYTAVADLLAVLQIGASLWPMIRRRDDGK